MRRRLPAFCLGVLLSFLPGMSSGLAQNPRVLLDDSFESYPTGVGTLTSPWYMTNSTASGVVASAFVGLGKAGYIGSSRTGTDTAFWTAAYTPYENVATSLTPIVRVTTAVGINPSTNGQHDSFAVEVYNQNLDRLCRLVFATSQTLAVYSASSAAPTLAATGYALQPSVQSNIRLELDLRANTWSAFLGSTQIVTNQPLAASGIDRSYREVDFAWFLAGSTPGNNLMCFDSTKVELISGPYPYFSTHPQGAVRQTGESITFTATATGTPAPALQWKKDGTDIPDATGTSLPLTDLALGDVGSYTVVATNSLGSVTSEAASLLVTSAGARSLVEWGAHAGDSRNQPAGITDWRMVAQSSSSSNFATLGVREDGKVHVWGPANSVTSNTPANLYARHVSIGDDHAVAIRMDGTLVAWGQNSYGEGSVPEEYLNLGGTQVASGLRHNIVLSGGSVYAWGSNYAPAGFGSTYTGQAESRYGSYTAVAAGYYHNLALTYDGKVVAWGDDRDDQCSPPTISEAVVAIGAGAYHSLAVGASGQVYAWGYNDAGQTNVPAGLTNAVAVVGGPDWSAALKADGTVVTWGGNAQGARNVPAGLTNVRYLTGGWCPAAVFGAPQIPSITSQPSGYTVRHGKSASLWVSGHVQASAGQATRPLRHRWFRGLPGDLSQPVASSQYSSFNIPSVTETQTFWARVESLAADGLTVEGAVNSTAATITMDPTPYVTSTGNGQAFEEGANAYIHFYFDAAPPYTIQWFKDGQPVSGGVVAQTGFAQYHFSPYADSQAGVYHAVLTNGSGSATTANISVQTRIAPPDATLKLVADIDADPSYSPNLSPSLHPLDITVADGARGLAYSFFGRSYVIPTPGAAAVELPDAGISSSFYLQGTLIYTWGTLKALAPGQTTPAELAAVSSVSFIAEWNGHVYFTAADAAYGQELWRTDGTPAGTTRLTDLNPGSGSGVNSAFKLGDALILRADNPATGFEPYHYNLTSGAITLIKDANAGTGSSNWQLLYTDGTSKALLRLNNTTDGSEPWITDGTPAGTFRLAQIASGTSSSNPSYMGQAGGRYVFQASTGTQTNVYSSDGTTAGTTSIFSNIVGPGMLETGPAGSYFSGYTSAAGTELYRTTGGTATLVSDIQSGTGSSSPTFLGNAGGYTLIAATTTAQGREVWRTNGTSAGTTLLKEITSGSSSTTFSVLPEDAALAGQCAFLVTSATDPGIWTSDGTAAGTVKRHTYPSPHGHTSAHGLRFSKWSGGILYIVTSQATTSGGHHSYLWAWNPVPNTFQLLHDKLYTHPSNPYGITQGVDVQGTLWYYVHDQAAGPELWSTKGTPATTQKRSADFVPTLTNSSSPWFVGSFQGDAMFRAYWREKYYLYRANADTGQVTQLGQFEPSSGGVEVGGAFYILGTRPVDGLALWKLNGTQGNFEKMTPASVYHVEQQPLVVPFLNGVFFVAATSAAGMEPWFCGGSAATTYQVANIQTGASSSSPYMHNARVWNNRVFFTVNNHSGITSNYGLYAWDGTTTTLLHNGQSQMIPYPITAISSGVLFRGYDSTNGRALWITNGTPGGTSLVKDFAAGPASGDLDTRDHPLWQGKAIISAYDGTDWQVHLTDGTSAGTVPLSPKGPTAYRVVINQGSLFFNSSYQLWKSDGTVAGTQPVITPFPAADRFFQFNDAMYYYSDVNLQGGVWRTLGTLGSTHRIHQTPTWDHLVIGNRAYLSADVPGKGVEITVLTRNAPVFATPPPAPSSHPAGTPHVLAASMAGADHEFQWYQGAPGDTSTPVGTNASTLTLTPGLGVQQYWVRVRADLSVTDSTSYWLEGITQAEGWARAIQPPASFGQNSPVDWHSDSDKDGLTLLQEFAHGTTWNKPDAPTIPGALQIVDLDGVKHLAYRQLRRTGSYPGVSYKLQGSPSLGTTTSWTDQSVILTVPQSGSPGPGLQHVLQVTPTTVPAAGNTFFLRQELQLSNLP